jgi:acyl-[acyl-carrier-protein]-phospholipid O-acyltransferase/long-chain-fatty-acid--[acyl-carrier-protein] ligase
MPSSSLRSSLSRLLEVFVTFTARLFYRVRALGAERLPKTGGVLLLANHLSYVDVIVLQMACPRRIRFVGHESLARSNLFYRWLYWFTGTIPISPQNALESTRRIVRVLQAGEVVLIFPEGSISRTGVLMELQRGFELIARRADMPVVPAAVDGLWGSLLISVRKRLSSDRCCGVILVARLCASSPSGQTTSRSLTARLTGAK